MLYVDREIAARIDNEQLIENANKSNITNIGYDLTAEYFAVSGEQKDFVSLLPGESAFVGTKENIRLPDNIAARIVLKNSRIRQGLSLAAPIYQPGHHTKVFFRLTNMTGDEIILSTGEKYATIIFEELSGKPEQPYAGEFRDEFDFKGLGNYQNIYNTQIKKIEKKTEDLRSIERTIYANVLVILTVFVALFSFITTNLSLMAQSAEVTQFLIYNFVMLGCIGFLAALLNNFIGTAKSKTIWLPCIFAFIIAIIIFAAA